MNFEKKVNYILKTLNENSYDAFLVGGAVRDILMGIVPKDYDICTNALPNVVKSIFVNENIDNSNEGYGVIVFKDSETKYEITTFRKEEEYLDHRHPNKITFVTNLFEDLERRDFTISSIAMDCNGSVFDYYKAIDDLKNKTIKTIGNPMIRFEEDCLRILRGIRLVSKYGFKIDEKTFEAMIENRKYLEELPIELISNEFKQIIVGDYFNDIFKYRLAFINLNEIFNYNDYDEYLKNCPNNILYRLAIIFFNHVNLLENFKLVNLGKEKDNLLRNGLFDAKNGKITDFSELKWRIYENYLKNSDGFEVMKVSLFLQFSYNFITFKEYNDLIEYMKIIKNDCFRIKDLKINGDDLITLGINDGKKIKYFLNLILENIVDDKIQNTHEEIIAFIKNNL